jgi:fibronectin type 3 domain-containing protein
MNWTEVTDGELDVYRLYRSTDGINFEIVKKTKFLSYKDTKVEAGSTYTYKVDAIDKFGNVSEPALSEAVTVKADITPPVVKAIIPKDGSKIKGRINLSAIAEILHVKNFDFSISKYDRDSVSLGTTVTGPLLDTAAQYLTVFTD